MRGIQSIKDQFGRLDAAMAQGSKERVAFKNAMTDRIFKAVEGYLDEAVVTETTGAPTAPLVVQKEEEKTKKKGIKGK